MPIISRRQDGAAADSRYALFRLAVTVVLATIGSIGLWSYVIVMPAVQAEFGVDRATASIPYTISMIFFALGNIVVGRLIDRIGMMLPGLAAGAFLGGSASPPPLSSTPCGSSPSSTAS